MFFLLFLFLSQDLQALSADATNFCTLIGSVLNFMS